MKLSSSVFFSSNKIDAGGGDGGVSLQQEVNWSDLMTEMFSGQRKTPFVPLKACVEPVIYFPIRLAGAPTHIRVTEAGNLVFSLFAFQRLCYICQVHFKQSSRCSVRLPPVVSISSSSLTFLPPVLGVTPLVFVPFHFLSVCQTSILWPSSPARRLWNLLKTIKNHCDMHTRSS